MLRRTSGLFAAGFVLLAMGCSSFNKEWSEAPAKTTVVADISGRWHGYWKSDADGHSGDLKCVVSKSGESDYRANFSATYFAILNFNYVANLKGTPTGDGVHLTGQQDLGAMEGGVYTYDGVATATDFDCKYTSKYDHGRFVMKRPSDAAK